MVHDISPPLSPALAVWPGDVAVHREVSMDMRDGDALNLSALRCTVHAGAHADAPSHFGAGAPSIEQLDLEDFIGPCQVVRVEVGGGTAIRQEDLPVAITAERVLFATGTRPDPEVFTEDFAAIDPRLAESLADRGVRLIGIDTPSVDLFDAPDLPTHKTCLRRNLRILENLALGGVEPGLYELIALPLHLVGFEASPVRAVLREQHGTRRGAGA
ncbi:MAG: cyclase family protein [Acidobacteriota bacterium]|nr:cyclase family protein [Acidobacteriota bacterium]MDQ7087325.1 cyclase family protein [Acidobacteriota bacterium]